MVNKKNKARFERKPNRPQPQRPRPTDEPMLAEDLAEQELDEAGRGGRTVPGTDRRSTVDRSQAPSADGDDAPSGEPTLIRLNKYLADHGVASRRRCDELIQAGQVSVDGQHVTELGLKVDPERQVIEVDGVVLKPKDARKRYYVLNKPSGVVCTNEPRETRPRAVDLITDPYKGRIYTVGRLDEESKGLILVTNDGEFANKIMHPRYGIEKTYSVRVAGRIDDDSLTKIREGVHLSEGRTSGARILVDRRTHDASQLTVTIHEGMNREIRRVFARLGYKVTELRRVRIGPLTDRGLKPGRWRELLNREVDALVAGKNETEGEPRKFAPGPRKRFQKKQGYAREFVKGGKLVPGAHREREAKYGARPDASFGAGPRGAGPRSARPRPGGPRGSGPRAGGLRTDGPRTGGPRTGGSRFVAPRASLPRADGLRPGAARRSEARFDGPRAGHGHAPHGGPRGGGSRSAGGQVSRGGPRAGHGHAPQGGPRGAHGRGPGGPRGGRGPAPRGGRSQRGGPR